MRNLFLVNFYLFIDNNSFKTNEYGSSFGFFYVFPKVLERKKKIELDIKFFLYDYNVI